MFWLFLELPSQGPLVICSYCWWGAEISFLISSNFRNRNPWKDAGLVIKALKSETIREITCLDGGADLTLDLLQCPFWCVSCRHGALPVLAGAQACSCTKPYKAGKLGKIKTCQCHLALDVVYSLSISMRATHFISWKETFLYSKSVMGAFIYLFVPALLQYTEASVEKSSSSVRTSSNQLSLF